MPTKVILLLALLSLCACASGQSTVTVIHTLAPSGNGQTISILAADPAQAETPEFRAYADKLSVYLTKGGYRVVPFSADARPSYVAYFIFGIDGGRLVARASETPQFGVTGYQGMRASTTMDMAGNMNMMQSATIAEVPTYGITGYDAAATTVRVFRRAVALDIYDTAKIRTGDAGSVRAAEVYSGRLISEGACGSIKAVMDDLLADLAKNFPGPSGTTRTEPVPHDKKNC